jgi:AraC-like DNA-binding protein
MARRGGRPVNVPDGASRHDNAREDLFDSSARSAVSRVVALLLFRSRKHAEIRGRVSQDPELLRRLLRAKDRMDAASHEEWPVRRLARVSGVSEAHFARSFKEAFGVPPHRYLLTRRIERATALLRETELAVTEIAFQTGWNSLGTFGRTFRDITGESPGELRVREKAAPHELERVPVCLLSAARRPDLTIAVSEKRRQEGGYTNGSEETEVA